MNNALYCTNVKCLQVYFQVPLEGYFVEMQYVKYMLILAQITIQ